MAMLHDPAAYGHVLTGLGLSEAEQGAVAAAVERALAGEAYGPDANWDLAVLMPLVWRALPQEARRRVEADYLTGQAWADDVDRLREASARTYSIAIDGEAPDDGAWLNLWAAMLDDRADRLQLGETAPGTFGP